MYDTNKIKSNQSQDYGDVSAQNTTRAPNNMQKLKS